MPTAEILQSIFFIATTIHDQLDRVKALKKLCTRFKERVEIIVTALKGLKDIPETERFINALHCIEKQLQAGLKLMQRFSHAGKISKFFHAKKYAGDFDEIYTNLDQACSDLNLGLIAKQIIDREQDRQEQKEDMQALIARQDEIWQLHQEEQSKLEQVQAEVKMLPAEVAEVVKAQYASFKFHMQQQLRDGQRSEEKAQLLLSPRYYIPYCDLKLCSVIYDGARCKIYEGKWGVQRVAIKLLKANLGEVQQKLLLREAEIMLRLRGPHFVSLYGVCTEPARTALIMEYMPCGTLKDKLKSPPPWTLPQKFRCAIELAIGLQALHQQKIIHGNFTDASVLFDENWHPKLAAFKVACTITQSIAPIPIKDISWWQAPELFKLDTKPTAQTDIYSYGAVLWEIFTGQVPHANFTKEAIPASCPPPVAKLIQACWNQDPLLRPMLAEVAQQLGALEAALSKVEAKVEKKEEKQKEEEKKEDKIAKKKSEMQAKVEDKKEEKKVEKKEEKKAEDMPEKLYELGKACETKKDFYGAADFYRRAAEKGHIKARTSLGFFYLHGLGGMPKDARMAEKLFLQSAQEGHARAQTNLATMYANGDGVGKSMSQASFWFHKAAEQGDKKANEHMQRLGMK